MSFYFVSQVCSHEVKLYYKEVSKINKRAKRALGRSPEEKVKGHSGAIYRGPLILSTKYW